MTAVKICGITRAEDAEAAAELGASFVGFVLWPRSPRAVSLERVKQIVAALATTATPVGVFVNPRLDEIHQAADAGIRVAQIHGAAAPEGIRAGIDVIRAVHLASGNRGEIEPDVPDRRILLDAHDLERHGGTGRTIDWARAAEVAKSRQVFLAGGLTPANVRQAIARVRPYAVDVASGVEAAPGVKDHGKLRAFFAAVKESV
jgi:phosphoribosylanthranilate isomerase